MKHFVLTKDRLTENGITWIESKIPYEIVREFDEDRYLINVQRHYMRKDQDRILTLVKKSDGVTSDEIGS